MKKSIIQLQEVKKRFDSRIDAEFFQPHYKKIDELINKHHNCELGEIAYKITDGTHYTPSYVAKGIPFLSAINVKENMLDLDCGYQYISEAEHAILYRRCAPKANDILLRKVGVGPRYATVIPNNVPEFSLFVSVALIKSMNICPYYLSTFINSYYGQVQLLRFNKGISQPDLHLEDISTLKVPLFQEKFSQLIEKIVKESYKNIQKQTDLYDLCQQIILQDIGILNWQPKHKLSYVKNFSDINSASRCDAEYFQPKYDEIIEKIQSYSNGWDTVGNLFNQNKKSFVINKNSIYKYVEIGSINTSNGEISSEDIIGKDLPANAKLKLNNGDILISKVRTYRGAVAIVENADYIGSGAFTVLQEKINCKINKETLYTFFKLKPILDLTLKYNTGTSYPTITDEDILNMPIPIFKTDIQNEVKEDIQEAKVLQLKSKQLLEIAKRGVEIAIEENEEVATSWINEQLSKIGVEI